MSLCFAKDERRVCDGRRREEKMIATKELRNREIWEHHLPAHSTFRGTLATVQKVAVPLYKVPVRLYKSHYFGLVARIRRRHLVPNDAKNGGTYYAIGDVVMTIKSFGTVALVCVKQLFFFLNEHITLQETHKYKVATSML